MAERVHVTHPFGPLFDERSRVLILGSFPSPKSREQAFFYGHPQNRFWRVIAAVLDRPVPMTVDEKRAFCAEAGIALWDVLAEVDIEGASDASIRNPRANDLGPSSPPHLSSGSSARAPRRGAITTASSSPSSGSPQPSYRPRAPRTPR